ncbi:Ribonucleoside-diphosphate reductase 1 subunit alpha [compost metagenome]
MDSANQNVLELVTTGLKRDWAPVRQDLIDNEGMRFSCVASHMPGESSSKAAGQPNGKYPVRDLVMTKTDNGIVSRWAAPEGDIWGDRYEIAWDINPDDQIDFYAIIQYFTDQGISADLWRRLPQGETVGSTELLKGFFRMTKYGFKSRYYYNTLTTEAKTLSNGEIVMVEVRNTDKLPEADCGAGGCKM